MLLLFFTAVVMCILVNSLSLHFYFFNFILTNIYFSMRYISFNFISLSLCVYEVYFLNFFYKNISWLLPPFSVVVCVAIIAIVSKVQRPQFKVDTTATSSSSWYKLHIFLRKSVKIQSIERERKIGKNFVLNFQQFMFTT